MMMRMRRPPDKLLNRARHFGDLRQIIAIRYLFFALIFCVVVLHPPLLAQPRQPQSETSSPLTKIADNPNRTTSTISITASELQTAIGPALDKVDEFRFIKKTAESLGIKVYLFGGTAAAFAHYLKWDLLRQKGDLRFHPARFDYKYINIYRSTQDLDIVVDGPESAIIAMAKALKENFPYLQGSKSQKNAWEVRSLRENIGDKLALLNSPDFLNQHTDSHSVGLIEITTPDKGMTRIRDLKDWENITSPGFLNDVIEGKIHYYFSNQHETTKFFREGRNPAILSVIRYFIKVAQLDLDTRAEDIKIVKRIIADFDPSSIQTNTYLKSWFSENGPKLIQNAIDVENAMQTIETIGLREKLLKTSDPRENGSLAWWMKKQPLETSPLGHQKDQNAPAPTAADLGIGIISHETTSFLVYEAITRSHQLLPNVLISRQGIVGESAAFGDGFYAMVGDRSGFRGTGFTIRFKVNPKAVLGSDFDFNDQNKYIVIKNRAAIEVLPENLKMDLIEYYNWLKSTTNLSSDDLGIYQRLHLALRPHFHHPSREAMTFLKSMSLDDLLDLMKKDPGLEGKYLLLGFALGHLAEPTTSDILKILESMQTTANSVSKEDREKFTSRFNEHHATHLQTLFITNKPTLLELQRAFELGLFINSEATYLATILPYLNSIDDILFALPHWKKFSSDSSHKSITIGLRTIGLRFFSLEPNIQQTKEFLSYIPNWKLSLGLGANKIYDPEVFAFALKSAIGKNSNNAEALRVWNARKKSFFGTVPDLPTLTQMNKQIQLFQVHYDTLLYVADHPTRRRTELTEFIKSLKPAAENDTTAKQAWHNALAKITDHYLTLKPSALELGTYLKNTVFTTEDRIVLLNRMDSIINSSVDFFNLTSKLSDKKALDQFVIEHPNKMKLFINSFDSASHILSRIGTMKAASVIIQGYAERFPQEHYNISELFMDSPLNTMDLTDTHELEALWERCFRMATTNATSATPLQPWLASVPTAKSYELFLESTLSRAESLDHFASLTWYQHKTRFEKMTPAIRATFATASNRIIPKLLLERISYFRTKEQEFSMNAFITLMQRLTDREAIITLTKAMIESPIRYNNSDWLYSWGTREPLLGLRPKLSKRELRSLDAAMVATYIIHREELTHPKHSFAADPIFKLLPAIFDRPILKALGLDQHDGLLIPLYNYFLLTHLRDYTIALKHLPRAVDREREFKHEFPFIRDYQGTARSGLKKTALALRKNFFPSPDILTDENLPQYIAKIEIERATTNQQIEDYFNQNPRALRKLNSDSSGLRCEEVLSPTQSDQ